MCNLDGTTWVNGGSRVDSQLTDLKIPKRGIKSSKQVVPNLIRLSHPVFWLIEPPMLDPGLPTEIKIRCALAEDLPIIVEIYNASIPKRLATADLKPITVESRQLWFANHHPDQYPLWVIEKETEIIGWLSLQRFQGRPAYQKTAEISIYVASNCQHRGVGRQLLQHAIKESPRLQLHTLMGLIFAHNEASLKLFRHFEFEQWGYLPKVADLDDIQRDLVIMGRKVG